MGVLTELYRRCLVYRHAPRHWLMRPDTPDRRLFREVVIANEYGLPSRFGPDDVVVDVGAHIGSFSYAALERGAGEVYCCEANPNNFHFLAHNLQPYRDRATLLPHAVWRSDRPVKRLSFGNPTPRNTGAGHVDAVEALERVPALAFDALVTRVTDNGARRIRLLKLDCEGAEWPILLTSRMLYLVDAICGEYHLRAYPSSYLVPGLGEYTPALLEEFLTGQGLHVRTQPCSRAAHLGLFFAERTAGAGGSVFQRAAA